MDDTGGRQTLRTKGGTDAGFVFEKRLPAGSTGPSVYDGFMKGAFRR